MFNTPFFGILTKTPEPLYEGAQKHKDFKFDSFLKGGEKNYKVTEREEWDRYEKASPKQKFHTKEEF